MSDRSIYVFDADGVAIRPWGFANALERDHSITREMTKAFFRGPFQDCLVGKANLRAIVADGTRDWGWSGTADELISLWMGADDLPDAAVLARVEELRSRGNVCCLASNQEAVRAAYISNEMGFANRFDHLFFSCHLGSMKPAGEYYAAIEETLGAAPGSLVLIDDSRGNVEAARERGWHGVVYADERDLSLIS